MSGKEGEKTLKFEKLSDFNNQLFGKIINIKITENYSIDYLI